MKVPKTKLGAVVVAAYLLLVLVACSPLIVDGAIHHGNGIAFLAATVLTLPLSWIAFWIIDSMSEMSAFLTGGPFYLAMVVLAVCAGINAVLIYLLVGLVGRRLGAFMKRPL